MSTHTITMLIIIPIALVQQLLAASSSRRGQSSTSTRIYNSIENSISSPSNSYEGCEQWFYEIARRNQDQCTRPIRPPARDSIPSVDGHPHKTYQDVTKITDGRYRCKPPRNTNGCNNDFLWWFKQQQFYIFCQPIDDVETQLKIDNNMWVLLGGTVQDPVIGRDPDLTFMWCEKQNNHQQLVAAREHTVDQAREILISRLGHDVASCIDRHL